MPARHARIAQQVLSRLKLRQLRLLVAVGQHGNILNAAREVGVSQPAATKMIQDLELDFEAQLFTRTNRGVIATPAGETLIRHGKLIFAQVAQAAQALDDLEEGSTGRVVVGTLLAASAQLLPRALDMMLRERPRVTVKVIEGTDEVLIPALRSAEIDMVLGRLPPPEHTSELVQERLIEEHIVAVTGAGHPLRDKSTLTFEHLKPYGWVLPPTETTLRHQIDAFFATRGQYAPDTSVESVSYLTNRDLLARRDFIGLMPSHVVASDLVAGILHRLDWTVPFGAGPVGVTLRRDHQLAPAGVAFLRALRMAATDI